MQPAERFTFGADGSVAPYLCTGWSMPERGFTWTSGTDSHVRLPLTRGAGALNLGITLSAFIHRPLVLHQRLLVTVNGVQVGEELIAAECALGLPLPREALDGHVALDITLHCPDATGPAALGVGADPRILGMAVHEISLAWVPKRPSIAQITLPPLPRDRPLPELVRQVTGLGLADLGLRFESLGHDCEFGLAQRQMGTETLGLLRFAGLSPRNLMFALERGFAGIERPGNLTVFTHDDGPAAEFMVRDAAYGMNMHTHRHAHQTDAASLLPLMHQHFRFLREKLFQDLADGQKISAFNFPGTRSANQMRPLLNLLRGYGPNVLLFVTDDGAEAPGTVRQLEIDLMQGWIGELGRERAGLRLDLHGWVSICANAYRLWRQAGHGADDLAKP